MENRKTGSAYYDYCELVRNSWTFQRMTEGEKGKCWDALHSTVEAGALKGVYTARWMILQAVYNAFLAGLGYNGPAWREPNPKAVPF